MSSRGRGYVVPLFFVYVAATMQWRFTWLPQFNRIVAAGLAILYASVEIEDVRFDRRRKEGSSPPPRHQAFAWFHDDATPGWWRTRAIWWATWMTPMIPNAYVCGLGLVVGFGLLRFRYHRRARGGSRSLAEY